MSQPTTGKSTAAIHGQTIISGVGNMMPKLNLSRLQRLLAERTRPEVVETILSLIQNFDHRGVDVETLTGKFERAQEPAEIASVVKEATLARQFLDLGAIPTFEPNGKAVKGPDLVLAHGGEQLYVEIKRLEPISGPDVPLVIGQMTHWGLFHLTTRISTQVPTKILTSIREPLANLLRTSRTSFTCLPSLTAP